VNKTIMLLKGSKMRKPFSFIFFILSFSLLFSTVARSKEKDTLSISLVQKADVKKLEDKEVVYERYTIKKGDHIWKLLRQRGLLQRPDFHELLSSIKSMNKSLTNLDLIHPGQTILIPINIIPKGSKDKKEHLNKLMADSSFLKDINFEVYRVRPGDNLTNIAKDRYNVPVKFFYSGYLNLVQKFNPSLTNPNLIYPDQVIRLPVYTPQMIRMPIRPYEKGPASLSGIDQEKSYFLESDSLRKKLKDIFQLMGEDWIDVGEYFIPLKSGGQINLKADSFPILNMSRGMRLIIDIKNELSKEVVTLVESEWEGYKIIHVTDKDTIFTSIDRILEACEFHKILRPGEELEIRDEDILISLSGDWVIVPGEEKKDVLEEIRVLAILNSESERTLDVVRTYLQKFGVKIIDYPYFSDKEGIKAGSCADEKILAQEDIDFPLPSLLLKIAGQPFSTKTKIPIHQGEGSGLNITVEADLFFNRNKRDCVIDILGLSSPMKSLLEKHQFLVLSIKGEDELFNTVERILSFLDIPFQSNLHNFFGSVRDESKNIKFTIQGISFKDHKGKDIFATDKSLPEEACFLLNQKGYSILDLRQFEE
jgi:hypothetical protein